MCEGEKYGGEEEKREGGRKGGKPEHGDVTDGKKGMWAQVPAPLKIILLLGSNFHADK